MSRSPAQVMTALLRNSVPLSKSKPVMVKGISCTPTCKAARTWACALLRIVRVKTHPVGTQVRFRVRANSPLRVGPQCATVSPSKNPRLGLHLIACLADLDRRPQQRRGFRGGDTPD